MILDKLMGLFSHDIAIDLGTANTVVAIKGKGIIINEPSVVAVQSDKMGISKILAVGKEAKDMIGKTPGNIKAVRPMKEGVIADFDMAEKMIRYFIEKAHKRRAFIRPRIIISVPYGLTQVERKAVRESALSAGARDVFLIEEPMAAGIGAGLPIKEAKGSLVVDIGGGTTEIGVISLGGLVICKSVRVAGDKIDSAIVEYVKRKYNLLIGERIAEDIKIEIGNATPLDENLKMVVKGRDQITHLLNTIELTSDDAREAMAEPLKQIAGTLKNVLEVTPPDLAADIIESGIALTGGGALIRNLDRYLSTIVKLPVYVAEEPLLAVARGTERALEEIELLHYTNNHD